MYFFSLAMFLWSKSQLVKPGWGFSWTVGSSQGAIGWWDSSDLAWAVGWYGASYHFEVKMLRLGSKSVSCILSSGFLSPEVSLGIVQMCLRGDVEGGWATHWWGFQRQCWRTEEDGKVRGTWGDTSKSFWGGAGPAPRDHMIMAYRLLICSTDVLKPK